MTPRPDFTLILPCFNEASHFETSFAMIRDVCERSDLRYEILLIDDASRDTTVHHIRAAAARYKNVRAMLHPQNLGRGATVAHGIKQAKGTIVGYMDIDCEVSPVYTLQCIRLIARGKADIVVGRRIYRIYMGSILRAIYSRGYQFIANSLVGTGGIDTESGYKFFNRKKILPILPLVRHPHWFWDTEIMVLSRRARLQIREVPVLFVRRRDKKSTVAAIHDIPDYLISLWRLRKRLSH